MRSRGAKVLPPSRASRLDEPTPAPAATRDRRTPRVAFGIVSVLVLAGAFGWAVWRRPHVEPSPPSAVVDALDAVPPWAAYDSALVLANAGRRLESLPFFRRAMHGLRKDFWQLHSNHASALYNITLQKTQRRGVVLGPTWSTWERAALIRASIHESARALELAQSPGDRATVLMLRGRLTHVYGLPWETLVAYREAQFANPQDLEMRRRADQLQANLEHPSAAITVRMDADEAGIAP